ncbi:MAG: hypothetical protein H6841_09660 [Planctomycetes bacterium]|nr:hypothetical protein [Planctomycetota bacterium]MCB9935397.1 hypothetical protein [Planctomycetota bacterium]
MPQIFVDVFFILLVLACGLLVLRAVGAAFREQAPRAAAVAALAVAAWLGLTAAIAASGVLAPAPDRVPPNLTVLAVSLVLTLLLTLGPVGRRVVGVLSAPKLVGFQVFRVPVELVLFMLAVNGAGPELLSFEGRNFDIITGLSAPFAAWLVLRKPNKLLVIGWNLLGLGLLLNVLVHAVLSMPGPMQKFFVQPGPEVVATFPYIWLPAFLVPLAFAGHVLSLRQALRPALGVAPAPKAAAVTV